VASGNALIYAALGRKLINGC